MARSVPEWIGKDDNSPVPPRVRERIWNRDGGKCQICERQIEVGEPWAIDHTLALILGGKNQETNLRAVHKSCHDTKTIADVWKKSKIARTRKKHLGISSSRPSLPGSRNSKWKKTFNRGWVLRNA